ncbi:MAG: hypothetical protein ABI833_07470 [Acidobacteriota bacterium]
MKTPIGASGDFGVSIGPNGLSGVPGKHTQKSEDLGRQTIGDIEFQGSRMTTTSDDQPSLVAVDELWISKDLGLIGLVSHLGPDGKFTARIQNPHRMAPDPVLFTIPSDYKIRDLE